MNLTKVLWGTVTGLATVIVFLLGAWGRDMTARVQTLDQRQDIVDQRYATLLVEMQDLREHMKDLQGTVEDHYAKH